MNLLDLTARLCEYRRDLISDGFDAALEFLLKQTPFAHRNIRAVPTGTRVWDWIVPRKWTLVDGWIEHKGQRIIDAAAHPFHVASYSLPVDADISFTDLQPHLNTSTRHPDCIPWDFHYYEPKWSFGLTWAQHCDLFELGHDGDYHVHIDSRFEDGALKVGEVLIPGEDETEVWLLAHLCHPHMANDNATGCAVLAALSQHLATRLRRYTYRILFTPETIGTIAYLATNEHLLGKRVLGGVVLDMVGHDEPLKLQMGYGESDLENVFLSLVDKPHPYRSLISNDDKVLNAPGVRIPTITLTRARGWQHPDGVADYYHTSGDTAEHCSLPALEGTLHTLIRGLDLLERNFKPVQTIYGPPCLSRHGLWQDWRSDPRFNMRQQHVLDLLDGKLSAAQIAVRTGVDMDIVCTWLDELRNGGLVREY